MLELILVMPILVIVLMALVELALLLSGRHTVEMASRAGAAVASQIALPESGNVPSPIMEAVHEQLATIGACLGSVIVQHNIDPDPGNGHHPPFLLVTGSPVCPDLDLPPPPTSADYVRVTVCVRSTELAPNLLKTFCFDISDRVTPQSTTWPYRD